jgi:hypothetical protein
VSFDEAAYHPLSRRERVRVRGFGVSGSISATEHPHPNLPLQGEG